MRVREGGRCRTQRIGGCVGQAELAFGDELSAKLNAFRDLGRPLEQRRIDPHATNGYISKDEVDAVARGGLSACEGIKHERAPIPQTTREKRRRLSRDSINR